jgi:hypothetical protein
MSHRRTALLLVALAATIAALPARRAGATEVVQIPVDGVLDARPVSTLTGGALVPWTVGIDQDDGFMTTAAAKSLHQTGAALPDDGAFAADAHHPAVVLHFSNAAPATAPQARSVSGVASFAFDVPPATYETLLLFLTSSYGDSKLEVTFQYADGTSTKTAFTMPDWGTGAALPAPPPTFFNLVGGLHKWTKAGASVDTPTHALAGVALSPAAGKTMVHLAIAKLSTAERLTFWGATGVATSRPDAGADAPLDASADVSSATGDAADAARNDDAIDTANAIPDAGAEVEAEVDAGRDAFAEERGPIATAPADASSATDAGTRPRATAATGCATAGDPGTDGGLPWGAVFGLLAHAARRGRRRRV